MFFTFLNAIQIVYDKQTNQYPIFLLSNTLKTTLTNSNVPQKQKSNSPKTVYKSK